MDSLQPTAPVNKRSNLSKGSVTVYNQLICGSEVSSLIFTVCIILQNSIFNSQVANLQKVRDMKSLMWLPYTQPHYASFESSLG